MVPTYTIPLGDSASDRAPRTLSVNRPIEKPGGSLIWSRWIPPIGAAGARQARAGRRSRTAERRRGDFRFWILDFGLGAPIRAHSLLPSALARIMHPNAHPCPSPVPSHPPSPGEGKGQKLSSAFVFLP